MSATAPTTSAATDTGRERRCHGWCGQLLPADDHRTFKVVEPDGRLREFCDSECLRRFYLDQWQDRLRSLGQGGAVPARPGAPAGPPPHPPAASPGTARDTAVWRSPPPVGREAHTPLFPQRTRESMTKTHLPIW
jgi:hypothetical protein